MLKSKSRQENFIACSKQTVYVKDERLFVDKSYCDSYFSELSSFKQSKNKRLDRKSKENSTIDADSPTTTALYSDTESRQNMIVDISKSSFFEQSDYQSSISSTNDRDYKRINALGILTYGVGEVGIQTSFPSFNNTSKSKSNTIRK